MLTLDFSHREVFAEVDLWRNGSILSTNRAEHAHHVSQKIEDSFLAGKQGSTMMTVENISVGKEYEIPERGIITVQSFTPPVATGGFGAEMIGGLVSMYLRGNCVGCCTGRWFLENAKEIRRKHD